MLSIPIWEHDKQFKPGHTINPFTLYRYTDDRVCVVTIFVRLYKNEHKIKESRMKRLYYIWQKTQKNHRNTHSEVG